MVLVLVSKYQTWLERKRKADFLISSASRGYNKQKIIMLISTPSKPHFLEELFHRVNHSCIRIKDLLRCIRSLVLSVVISQEFEIGAKPLFALHRQPAVARFERKKVNYLTGHTKKSG